MKEPSHEETLFEAAACLGNPVERAAFLDGQCAGDSALRRRLEALLAAHGETDPLSGPQPPAWEDQPGARPQEHVGMWVGRYKLLEKLGVGGFGEVWAAEQKEPVRRRVALKVIKLGMDTQQVVARFQAERQALALMDHPNIARVLDAGATETGRLYFVMELVKGIPITNYCVQEKLDTKGRLDLFMQVCHAIQHAHQKGIIHRDIKPSNIMVTLHDGVPVPKVIDFGIAKATQQELTEQTIYTQYAQFLGTPAYMSPEQAGMSGLDIDTRSDIYSLGVLLYELLTGTTPFDTRTLMQSGLDGMRKIIREQEPAKPSTRMRETQAQAAASSHPRTGQPPLSSDLDWIVMKCLEKDRQRRYDTANGVATDIQRHLTDEPIAARPPSAAYRFQKALRRHKLAFTAGTAVLTALAMGIAFSSWQAVRANREADRATAARAEAQERLSESEAIAAFLTEVFQSSDPARDGRTITVAESLDTASAKLESGLATLPERRARLQTTLARTYEALGLHRESIQLHGKVRDHYQATSGPEHPDTLAAMEVLAISYRHGTRHKDAMDLQKEVLTLRRKVLGPEHPQTLNAMLNLANSLRDTGRMEAAISLQEELLALSLRIQGPDHPGYLRAMSNLATYYDEAGHHQQALKWREELLAANRRVNGPESYEVIVSTGHLATSYEQAGRRDEALKLNQQELTLSRTVNGPVHPNTLVTMVNLGSFHERGGDLEEALKLRVQALDLMRKVLGPEHPDTVLTMVLVARSYSLLHRPEEALQLYVQVLPLVRKRHGGESRETLTAITQLSDCHHEAGQSGESIRLHEEALPISRRINGPEHPDTLRLMTGLAIFYDDAGLPAEARRVRGELLPLLETKLAEARKSAASQPENLEGSLRDVAEVRYRLDQFAAVEALYLERLQSRRSRPGAGQSDTVATTTASLGRLLSEWAWAERETHPDIAQERAIEGVKLLQEAIASRQADPDFPAWKMSDLQSRLGGARFVLAFTDPTLTPAARELELREAETLLLESHAAMERDQRRVEKKYRRDGMERLIRLYEAWQKPTRIARWKKQLEQSVQTQAVPGADPGSPLK